MERRHRSLSARALELCMMGLKDEFLDIAKGMRSPLSEDPELSLYRLEALERKLDVLQLQTAMMLEQMDEE